MKVIPLTKGAVALVDTEDYESLRVHKWSFDSGYAVTRIASNKVKMHRLVLGLTQADGKQVDHINGDGCDNRRENLRLCTQEENKRNRRMYKNNSSGFKGVSSLVNGVHVAHIRVLGKRIHLGRFATAKEAAEAYDRAAKKHFGKFAKTNADLGLLQSV